MRDLDTLLNSLVNVDRKSLIAILMSEVTMSIRRPPGLMEKEIMSKHTSYAAAATSEQTRELTEAEFGAVSGGYTFTDVMVESFFGGLGNDTLDCGAGLRSFRKLTLA
jgi:hypothetical protein